MGRRGRRQHHRAISLCRELRRELARSLAVEADRLQQRTQFAQPREVVRGRLADRRIKPPLALAGAQHIPQPETMDEQARQAFGIRQRSKRLADQCR